ncbi:MAG: S-methyl-5'-thioadenosine phosphorylase [Myxococcota bacterium]|jgi:5'-methylthioadenosine phosphorylase|nr:S-methyl-5'-thioadenosine phosphorylase [Myxococcota bacterium]
MKKVSIAVIGGSGVYGFEGLDAVEEVRMQTPFGPTSDAILIGRLGERQVAFLSRHGRGHPYNPSQVPYRANIWALKKLGVFWCVSVSAVGSLRREIEPEHFVIPDQLIDRTRSRADTFFDELAVHVGFAQPFEPGLRQLLLAACRAEGVTVHDGGTYVCMEGPLFSTKAESEMHRSWGASLIGMTALPEAKLAREAEMAYATIALATDYDCWHDEVVTVEMVVKHLQNNAANVQRVLKRLIPSIPLGLEHENSASRALENAIMTAPALIPEKSWEAFGDWLEPRIGPRPFR